METLTVQPVFPVRQAGDQLLVQNVEAIALCKVMDAEIRAMLPEQQIVRGQRYQAVK